LAESLPPDLKAGLPSIEELENELGSAPSASNATVGTKRNRRDSFNRRREATGLVGERPTRFTKNSIALREGVRAFRTHRRLAESRRVAAREGGTRLAVEQEHKSPRHSEVFPKDHGTRLSDLLGNDLNYRKERAGRPKG